MASQKEYTFKLFPTKAKAYVRSHYCSSDSDAKHELTGMMYAMFFEHRAPRAELWCNGKMIHSMK